MNASTGHDRSEFRKSELLASCKSGCTNTNTYLLRSDPELRTRNSTTVAELDLKHLRHLFMSAAWGNH